MANKKDIWVCLAIFAISLCADLCFNNLLSQPGRLHIFDSCHYMQAGLFLTIAVQHYLGASATAPANLGQMLLLDGFGMPFCGALAALLSSNKMTAVSMIFVQSAVVSLTAAFTYLITRMMKFSIKWAAVAGLAWAFYPAAICSAGTFLSEPLSGLFMVALTLAALACRLKPGLGSWLAYGFVAGSIMVTKPALLIYLALTVLILAFVIRPLPSIKMLASGALGAILALLPWLMVTAAFTGSPEIMPSRLPSTNMALGCDGEIGYWETMPVPPATLRNYGRNPIRVFYELVTEHTAAMPAILANKFARLWLAPFNDFHDTVFAIDFGAQRVLHALIVALAALAIPVILFAKNSAAETKLGLWLIMAAIATHCCYMPFESLPRYAFSAMPLVIIAAVALLQKISQERSRLDFLWLALAIGGAFLASQIQFEDFHTIDYQLKAGESLERLTTLHKNDTTTGASETNWLALVSDTDLNKSNCKIKFNGKEVLVEATNLRQYPTNFLHQKAINEIQDLLCRVRGITLDQLAHYSAIVIPANLFKADQTNTIEIIALAPLVVHGQKEQIEDGYRLIPALRYFSVTKMFASKSGLDGRVGDHRIPIIATSSYKINGASLNKDEELRLFLLASPQKEVVIDAQAGHKGSPLRLW